MKIGYARWAQGANDRVDADGGAGSRPGWDIGRHRIGAGTGAVIAEPLSASVGGRLGAGVGGPNILRPRHDARGQRSCWRDGNGCRGH